MNNENNELNFVNGEENVSVPPVPNTNTINNGGSLGQQMPLPEGTSNTLQGNTQVVSNLAENNVIQNVNSGMTGIQQGQAEVQTLGQTASQNVGTVPVQPMPSQQPMQSIPNQPMGQPMASQPVPNQNIQPATPLQMQPNGNVNTYNQPTMGEMQMNQPPVMPNGTQMAVNNNEVTGDKPKKPIGLIIVTILVVAAVVAFLTLYLSGKIHFGDSGNQGSNNSDDDIVDIEEEDNHDKEDIGLNNWLNYLYMRDIWEVRLTKNAQTIDENEVTIVLDNDYLKEVFLKLNDCTLLKKNEMVDEENFKMRLEIISEKDGMIFKFSVLDNYVVFDDNPEFSMLLDENSRTELDFDDKIEYVYVLENFDSNFFDKYFEIN